MSGDATPVQADAIDFTGGTTNSLTLNTTAANGGLTGGLGLGGTVTVDPGAATTLTSVLHDYSGSATGSLVKAGAGALTLSGANTYTGSTTISAGMLLVNGSTAGSAATVANGATLGGSGTTGAVTSDGTVSAGATAASIGTLTTGALTLNGDATLREDVASVSSADLVKAGGAVELGGTLDIEAAPGFTSAYGQSITLVDNTGAQATTTGTFTGLVVNGQGSTFGAGNTFTANGRTYQVNYAANVDGGGTANDVTITDVTATPGAPTVTAPANGTDTNSRTITGTTTAGDTVQVTVTPAGGGAATTGAATVTGTNWSYTPATPLADGQYTVTATQTAPGDTASAASAPDTFTLDTMAPAASSVTDTVAQGSGATPIGLAAPSDNLTPAGNLAIAAGALPTDGLVTLGDGTPVVSGQALTAAQITGLLFTPAGAAGQTSAFTYTVTDGAGNASQGAATLNVGAPNTPPSTTPTPAPAPDAISIAHQVTYDGSAFAITGAVSSASGVSSVEVSAVVDGVATELGAATVNGNGTFSFKDLIGASTQGFITATETDGAGGTASAQADYSLQGGLDRPNAGRAPFVAEQDVYTADGSATTSVSLFRGDGSPTNDASRRTTITAAGQTFTSDQFDDFKNGGTPETTFVFNPNHGLDTISLFRVDNVDHDTLSFSGADYGNSIANVLRHTTQTPNGSAVIHDPTTGDLVKLVGVTKKELAAYAGQDIAFHA